MRPTCSFPKGVDKDRLNYDLAMSDSASSVHGNGTTALQESLPLEERRSSKPSMGKLNRQVYACTLVLGQ